MGELRNDSSSVIMEAASKQPLFLAEIFWSKIGDLFYLPFAPFHYEAMKQAVNTALDLILVVVPRGFGKTKIFGVLLPIWYAFFKREPYIMIISYSEGKAKQSLRDITALLARPEIKAIFGDFKAEAKKHGYPWGAKGKRFVNHALGIDCFIEPKGSGMHILGASEEAARPTLVILEDIMSPEQAKSPQRTADLLQWYGDVLDPAMAMTDVRGQSGRVIINGTPFEPGDFMSTAMNWSSAKKILFPALNEKGESIWPEMISTEKLLAKKNKFIERGQLASWESQFMLNPKGHGKISFPKREAMIFRKVKEIPDLMKECSEITIIVDAAYTQQNYSDKSGVVVTGLKNGNTMVAFEVKESKYTEIELFDVLWALRIKYLAKLTGIFLESKQFQWARQFFYLNGVAKNQPLDISPIKMMGEQGDIGKVNRINNIVPYAHVGNVEIVESQCEPLILQMLAWNGLKQKGFDTLDAFSYNQIFLTDPLTRVKDEKDKSALGEKNMVDAHFDWHLKDLEEEKFSEAERIHNLYV